MEEKEEEQGKRKREVMKQKIHVKYSAECLTHHKCKTTIIKLGNEMHIFSNPWGKYIH